VLIVKLVSLIKVVMNQLSIRSLYSAKKKTSLKLIFWKGRLFKTRFERYVVSLHTLSYFMFNETLGTNSCKCSVTCKTYFEDGLGNRTGFIPSLTFSHIQEVKLNGM